MKNLTFTSFLLIGMVISSIAQIAPPCQCLATSEDSVEKLIAYMESGSEAAKDFYLNTFKLKNIRIDKDLENSVKIFLYPSRWKDLKYLKQSYEELEKYYRTKDKRFLGIPLWSEDKKNKFEENFWIQTKRLDCFKNIVSTLESNPRFSKKKSERNEHLRNYEEKAIDKPFINPKPSEPDPKKNETVAPNTVGATTKTVTQLITDFQKRVIGPYTIYFNEDEITLDSQDIEILKSINDSIKSNKVVEIIIEGFASKTGSRATNFAISMSRCFAIKNQIQSYNGNFNILPVGETNDENFRAVVVTLKSVVGPEKEISVAKKAD